MKALLWIFWLMFLVCARDIHPGFSRYNDDNHVLGTSFNKIYLYTKNGDDVQEEDADKAEESIDAL